MEKFLYEVRPYFFLLGGMAAMFFHVDQVMMFFGSVLCLASIHIIRDRFRYRTS